MSANNNPIYSGKPDVQSSALIAAVNASLYNAAGTLGTDIYNIWTADATNGGFLQRVRIQYVANATTASNACVMRLFITTKSGTQATSDADTFFYESVAIPSTGTLTTTAGNSYYDVPFNFALKPGQSVCAKITVAQPANCGFIATGIGGNYTA